MKICDLQKLIQQIQQSRPKLKMMLPSTTHQHSNPQKSHEGKEKEPVVHIEFCHNCDSHLTIIKHQESKYISHFQQVKTHLQENGFAVKKRHPPSDLYRKSPYCPPNVYYRGNGEIAYFPQIGSFQVYFQGTRVFSKLQTKKWPAPEHLVSLVQSKQAQKSENKKNKGSEPQAQAERSSKEVYPKQLGDPASKTHYLRWRKTPLQNERYSLERRNLLKSDAKPRVSKSFHHKSVDKKHLEQSQEAQILKMYNPGYKKQQSARPPLDMDAIPSIQGKVRVKNANVYLEPIYPQSRVSYQNYQRHRLWYAKKIHEERMAYQAEKIGRASQVKNEEPPRMRSKKSKAKINQNNTILNKSIETKKESISANKSIEKDKKSIEKVEDKQEHKEDKKKSIESKKNTIENKSQKKASIEANEEKKSEKKQESQKYDQFEKNSEEKSNKEKPEPKQEEKVEKEEKNEENYDDAFEADSKINDAKEEPKQEPKEEKPKQEEQKIPTESNKQIEKEPKEEEKVEQIQVEEEKEKISEVKQQKIEPKPQSQVEKQAKPEAKEQEVAVDPKEDDGQYGAEEFDKEQQKKNEEKVEESKPNPQE